MSSELFQLSAVEALVQFQSGALSPVELMRAVIARAEATEPIINAFASTWFDEALVAARLAEDRYRGKGRKPRALEGIPYAVKEVMAVKGQPLTNGSLAYKDVIADHTAPLAQRMLDAGAIIHARTTCPEFCCVGFTHSRLFGITRNPWNPAFDVGGSSGGAAASLASGSSTLASGSDIGGSIRIPASCCGVVGFKPPYGRVPQDPPFHLDHYSHDGPLARTVADAVLFQNVIAGPHPHDIASLRPKARISNLAGDISGWKVALCIHLGDFLVDPEVERNTRAAAEAFRDAGVIVEEIEMNWTREAIDRAARKHYSLLFAQAAYDAYDRDREALTPYGRSFAEVLRNDALTVEQGLALEQRIASELGDVLQQYRLLLCPTMALPALEAGKDYVSEPAYINGVPSELDRDVFMTVPFNICSRCPIVNVPSGLSGDGIPTGLQIVGRTYDDASVFNAALAFERAKPWAMPVVA